MAGSGAGCTHLIETRAITAFSKNLELANLDGLKAFLDANKQHGNYLEIKSKAQFSFLINGKLIDSYSPATYYFSFDSLAQHYSSYWTVEIYSEKGFNTLTTKVVSKTKRVASNEYELRSKNYFLNFTILSSLILIIYFVVLFRSNPRLTVDYFNFFKLFAVYEREENLLNTRIVSSVNLLFYLFSCLMCALLVLIIFHNGHNEISLAKSFSENSIVQCFLQWMKLTVIFLTLYASKYLLITTFSYLFKMKEHIALQFFNYLRLSFCVFLLLIVMQVYNFISEGVNPKFYLNLLWIISAAMVFWVMMIFLKLMARRSHKFFQLFSYLCASEIIPVMILLKILF